ncbi:MAG TPA: D-alanine--D-alanine ligase family protein [Acidimicrobiales bacterium]
MADPTDPPDQREDQDDRDGSNRSDPPDGRINLVVLFGGQSAEHDVSRVTAAHVLRAADPARYNITAVGISRDGQWQLAEGAVAALGAGHSAAEMPAGLAVEGPATSAGPVLAAAQDAGQTVVLPLLHGPLGEDGTVQGLLELADVPYVGSGVLGSAVAMDKAMAKQVLAHHGIDQARWLAFREHEVSSRTPSAIADRLGLPVFVKPANMGSSVGVTKAKSLAELEQAMAVALTYDEWVVVEEAVIGREIEVAVLGNEAPRASVPGEIIPGHEFYDYDDKYLSDGARLLVPAPLDDDAAAAVRQLAVEVFLALRCEGMARIDFLYEEGGRGFLCNEANTIPGFTPISMYPKLWQATGLGYRELIDELVRLALDRHGRRRRNTKR